MIITAQALKRDGFLETVVQVARVVFSGESSLSLVLQRCSWSGKSGKASPSVTKPSLFMQVLYQELGEEVGENFRVLLLDEAF